VHESIDELVHYREHFLKWKISPNQWLAARLKIKLGKNP
jgi:hypothetical protein